MARKVTNQILEKIEEGILDPNTVVLACLQYMSERDVADMAHINELIPMEEEEDNEDNLQEKDSRWVDLFQTEN